MTCQILNEKHIQIVYPHYPPSPPLALPRPAYYSPYRGGTHAPDSIVPASANRKQARAKCYMPPPRHSEWE